MRALVTGGSRGIGRATALRLARAGHEVAVHYRSGKSEAAAVVAEITQTGGQAFAISGDIGRSRDVDGMADEIARRWDHLEVIVHNAGEYPRAAFTDLSDDDFRSVLEVQVVGPAHLTRRLLPLLRSVRSGRVIFVSSVLAFTGSRRGAHYAAAKAAVQGLAKSLALELAPAITVNTVAPGSIDTAILAGDSPRQREERNRAIPLGRVGDATEVAEAIAFLASPSSSYLTGTTMHVNGGIRAD